MDYRAINRVHWNERPGFSAVALGEARCLAQRTGSAVKRVSTR